MLKFLHAADIHLDSPLVGLSAYKDAPLELLRGATRRAFERLVEVAVEEKVAFVVIAGDLYDGEWKDFNTGIFFARMLGRLRESGIDVVILHGNHDAESNLTRHLPLPDGVRVFSSRKAETIELKRHGVALHGRSFRDRETTENLVPGYPPPLAGLVNIGVLHTALEGSAEHAAYAPCSLEELRNKGYQYWALGHVHVRQVLCREPWIVFAGNLQGRHARELGPKGAMLVTIDGQEIVAAEAVDVDVLRWAHVEVDAGTAASCGQVESLISEVLNRAIAQESDGRPLATRVTIGGSTRAHNELIAGADSFIDNVRAIGAGLGADQLWIEKVRIKTHADRRPSPAAGGVEAVDDLARLVAGAPDAADLLATLRGDLDELWRRVPSDVRLLRESGPLSDLADGRFDDVLRDAVPHLLARLKRES